MNHEIVQMGGEHSNEVSGRITPIGLTGPKGGNALGVGNIGTDFREPAHSVHIDGDG
jgi:hypothetical protein